MRRQIIAPPDGERVVELLDQIRKDSQKGYTRPPGVKVMRPEDDVLWDGVDAEGGPKRFSIRDISGELSDAEGRIREAEQKLEEARADMEAAKQTAEQAQADLDTLENVTLPDAVAQLEEADRQTQQGLIQLNTLVVEAQQDVADAQARVEQAEQDLAAEQAAREQLAQDMQAQYGELDGRLAGVDEALEGKPDFDDLTVGNLVAGDLVTREAVIEKLWADGIVAKTIASQSLVVSPGNVIPNGNGAGGRGDEDSRWGFTETDLPEGVQAYGAWTRDSSQTVGAPFKVGSLDDNPQTVIRVEPGRDYVFSYWVKNTAASNLHFIRFDRYNGDTSAGSFYPVNGRQASTSWERREVTVTADQLNGADRISLYIWGNHTNAAETGTFSITGLSLVAKVGAVQIKDGAVSADQINAQSVAGAVATFLELTTDNLVAGNATIDQAVINKLWADGLVSKTVETSRVSVSSGNQYIYGGFASWPSSTSSWSPEGGYQGGGTFTNPAASGTVGQYDHLSTPLQATKVSGGVTYRFGAWFKGAVNGKGPRMYIRWFDSSGTATSSLQVREFTAVAGEWVYGEQDRTAPSNAAYVALGFYAYSGYTGSVIWSNPSMIPLVGSTLIEDGAVTTSKLTVTEEMAAAIVNAMSIQTKELVVTESAVLQHAKLLGETIVEDINVTGKLIGSDGVFTGTVDFANVNVTGEAILNKIASNSIDASKIKGDSFSGNTFTGGTFVGGIFSTHQYPSSNGGVHIQQSTGIRGWNSSGNQTFQLDTSSGNLSISSPGRINMTNSQGRGIIMVPLSNGGASGGGMWFTHTGAASGSAAAIWRDGYTDYETEPLNLRGANGSHVRVIGGLGVEDGGIMAPTASIRGDISAWGGLDINGGGVYFRNLVHTSSAGNVFINTNTGLLAMNVSSRRYKQNIRDWEPTVEQVLSLRPVLWEPLNPDIPEEEGQTFAGWIAEEVDEIEGMEHLVTYAPDEDGELRPESVNYDRFPAAQQVVLRAHEERINELEQENTELRARLDAIEAMINQENA